MCLLGKEDNTTLAIHNEHLTNIQVETQMLRITVQLYFGRLA